MKPNEYKIYRKIEEKIITYLHSEEVAPGPLNRAELEFDITGILGRELGDSDLKAVDQMIEDEKMEGTIDFSNLEKYGIYREQDVNIPQYNVPGHWDVPSLNYDEDLFAALTGGLSPANQNAGNALTEQTLSMIRRQLADITYIEHYLQDMKKELIEMTEKLQGR